MIKNANKVICFDGGCTFCNKMIDFIMKNNRKDDIYFISSQSKNIKHYFKSIIMMETNNTIYYKKGHNVYSKSKAALAILNDLDGIYPYMSSLLAIIPSKVLDRCYEIIAKHRYKICSKETFCFRNRSLRKSNYIL